jgi:hypothetical protein
VNIDTFICVFHRDIDADRFLNLQTVLQYYHTNFPDLEIFLVEEDRESVLGKQGIVPTWVNYIFAYNPGPFNQAWALNIAMKMSGRPIGASVCNDAIIRPETFNQAQEAIRQNHYTCYIPYFEFYNLNPNMSEAFRRTMQFNFRDSDLYKRYGPNPPEKAGGIIFFDRAALLNIGGFNENFRGYGAEDDFLSFTSKILGTYGSCLNPELNLYHLYHVARPNHCWGNEDYFKNFELYKELRTYDIDKLRAYLNKMRDSNQGDINKYAL